MILSGLLYSPIALFYSLLFPIEIQKNSNIKILAKILTALDEIRTIDVHIITLSSHQMRQDISDFSRMERYVRIHLEGFAYFSV